MAFTSKGGGTHHEDNEEAVAGGSLKRKDMNFHIFKTKKNNLALILMTIAAFLLLLCMLVFIPHSSGGTAHKKRAVIHATQRNPGIAMACKATRFRDACEASLSSLSATLRPISSQDVIQASMQVASRELAKAHSLTVNLASLDHYNGAVLTRDCEYFLRRAASLLSRCQSSSPLTDQMKGMRTWMSAALTYQHDCHANLALLSPPSPTLEQTKEQAEHALTLTSNALSMLYAYQIYGSNTAAWKPPNRRSLVQQEGPVESRNRGEEGLDRDVERSLLMTDLVPDAVVSKNGSGNYSTIQSAVDSAPDNANQRYVIYIRAGVYNETVKVPYSKTSLTFIGDGIDQTIVTGNRNVMMPGVSTYDSATIAIEGDGFIARDMTFENTAGPDMHQAVALRVDSDLSAFHNCAIRGYQATLYAHSLRQFYRNCKIEGTIDFIFGDCAAIFQNCYIGVRPGSPSITISTITAQARMDPAQPTGIIVQNSTINGTDAYMSALLANPSVQYKAYLGRPWRLYSRTIFMQSYLDSLIQPEGWLPWDGAYALDTLFYGEYNNRGPGSAPASSRVKWSNQLTMVEALLFTVGSFIQGDRWLPSTTIPFNSLL